MLSPKASVEEIMDESNIIEIYIRDLQKHLIEEEGFSPSDFYTDIVRSHAFDRTSELNYFRGILRGLHIALDIIEERIV